jgi:hypothetical protein
VWKFNWNEESTKRGCALLLSGTAALVGLDLPSDKVLLILAAGQALSGLLGTFRSGQ